MPKVGGSEVLCGTALLPHATTVPPTTLEPTRAPAMRQALLLLQLLFSAARRMLSPSGAVLPLIRIIAALKRFVRGCFKSFKSSGVPTLPRPPESHGTPPQRRVQSAQAPDRCMPSSLPTGLHGQQEDALLPLHSVAPVPDITSPPLPKPLVPQWFQRYQHRRPVYVMSHPC